MKAIAAAMAAGQVTNQRINNMKKLLLGAAGGMVALGIAVAGQAHADNVGQPGDHNVPSFDAELRADGFSVTDTGAFASWVCSQRAAGRTSRDVAQSITALHYAPGYPQAVDAVNGAEYHFCPYYMAG
jgi:hypothetical protein